MYIGIVGSIFFISLGLVLGITTIKQSSKDSQKRQDLKKYKNEPWLAYSEWQSNSILSTKSEVLMSECFMSFFGNLFLLIFWIAADKKMGLYVLLSLFQIFFIYKFLKFLKSLIKRFGDTQFNLKLNQIPLHINDSLDCSILIPKQFQNVEYCSARITCFQQGMPHKKNMKLWENKQKLHISTDGIAHVSMNLGGGEPHDDTKGIGWILNLESDLFNKNFRLPVFEKIEK